MAHAPLSSPPPLRAGARWLLTAGGLGRAPVAPGTAAALATAGLLYASLGLEMGPWPAVGVLLGGASVVTLLWAGRARRPDGGGDPGWVVADEVAGQALAWLPVPWLADGLVGTLAAFALFRLFDIWKPGPVGSAERLPGGVGVLADDLLAGLASAALVAGLGLLGV